MEKTYSVACKRNKFEGLSYNDKRKNHLLKYNTIDENKIKIGKLLFKAFNAYLIFDLFY